MRYISDVPLFYLEKPHFWPVSIDKTPKIWYLLPFIQVISLAIGDRLTPLFMGKHVSDCGRNQSRASSHTDELA